MAFWHNLIDSDTERKSMEGGCFPWELSVYNGQEPFYNKVICDNVLDTLVDDVLPGLNTHDIYRYCQPTPIESRSQSLKVGEEEKTYKKGFTTSEYAPWFMASEKLKAKNIPECVWGTALSEFLNRPDVRDDMNIDDKPLTYQIWEFCTQRVGYTIAKELSLGFYAKFKTEGIRMLHYSGNTDFIVPTTGTREWIYEQNWKILDDWSPYYIKDGKQVGGYVETREGITFASVQGVGHFAAQWKPEAVYHIVNKFLDDQPIKNQPFNRKESTKSVSE
jgi:hypothetical protein